MMRILEVPSSSDVRISVGLDLGSGTVVLSVQLRPQFQLPLDSPLQYTDLLFVSRVHKLCIDSRRMNYKESNNETGAENEEKVRQHSPIKSSVKSPRKKHRM